MPRHSATTSLFGRRLREARTRLGIPQDKLGVAIGIDEGSSSARISRYETGANEPPIATAANIAKALKTPLAYFYCADDQIAELLLLSQQMTKAQKAQAIQFFETLVDPKQ